jgi:hypothetical protein
VIEQNPLLSGEKWDKARIEVIKRLLEQNHERYEEEVRQGLHGEKAFGGIETE